MQKNKALRTAGVILLTAIMAISVASCKKSDNRIIIDGKEKNLSTVMKIDGKDISLTEYKYFFMGMKSQYEKQVSADAFNDSNFFSTFKDQVLSQIKQKYAINNMIAAENLTLTDDDKKEIFEQKNDTIEQYGGQKEFEAALKENYLTEELYDSILENNALQNKLSELYFGDNGKYIPADAEIVEYAKNNNYIIASHILVKDSEGTEEKKQKAEEILARAKKGEDFNELINEFNEDEGMKEHKNGYLFTKGDMLTEFEEAAYALEENQISDVVKTTAGYHIIKRMPLTNESILEQKDSIQQTLMQEKVNTMVDTAVNKLNVELSKEYDKITAASFDFKDEESSSQETSSAASNSGDSTSSTASDSTSSSAE